MSTTISETMTALADAVRAVTGRTEKMNCTEMLEALADPPLDSEAADRPLIDRTLVHANIPDGTSRIGESAFMYCTSLTSVVIPDSVTTIGDSAFSNCTSLTSVVIPDSVTTIGYGAFWHCISLTSVVISSSVTRIDNSFFNCTSLTSVVIPSSVTSIRPSAFNSCGKTAGSFHFYFKCSEDEVPSGYPWGATNATCEYNYKGD